jgi:excinuclease ABC subunit C
MILQKLRDESHRFSITANRSSRTKAMKKNILEEIPGIWPVTRKKLLRIAGSIENLSSLSHEEITKVCTEKQYKSLCEHWII